MSNGAQSESHAATHEQLLENVVALERFQIEIRGAGDREEMLRIAQRHLEKFLPIETADFYFPDAGCLEFVPHLPPDQIDPALLASVDAAIESGMFGWALRHPRPAPIKTKNNERFLVLGALRTRQQIMGMFAAILPAEQMARWDNHASVLSTSLSILADALLSDELTRQLQEHNRKLDELVRKRTQELEKTADELAESQKLIGSAASVTQLLLAPTDLDSALHRSAVLMGLATRSDRVCFVQRNSILPHVSECIQWLGAEMQADAAPDLPSGLWEAELCENQTVLSHMDQSSGREQDWLRIRGIQSLLLIPVVTGEVNWGYLRFDSCKETRHWSSSELSTLTTVSSNMGLAFRRDLHARQLQAAKESAEVANHAKDRFLAMISHELRTPLNAIMGYAQALGKMTSVPPDEAQQISVIHDSAEHLLALINDLLDLAKAEFSRIELAPGPVAVPQVVQEVTNIVHPSCEEKRLDLRCEIGTGVPNVIDVDRKRLRQVLINLLGNAVKFTERGSIALSISRTDTGICFRVSDTGCGISDEDLLRLFQPFQQVGNLSQRQEGSGLGLAISRKIVETMGSTLNVSSTPGEGSSFWFELPFKNVVSQDESGSTDSGSSIELRPSDPGNLPEPARLKLFQDLLTKGDILELQSQIAAWKSELKTPNPMASKLHDLACEFRMKALRQILFPPSAPTKAKS